MGQRYVCTFRHALRAAYRTAISGVQILVLQMMATKVGFVALIKSLQQSYTYFIYQNVYETGIPWYRARQ